MQRRKSGLTNLEIPLMRIQAVRQATLEVTGSSRARVHIDPAVWYIAVGLGYPGRVGTAKGWVVHPLKSHMSWVQYVARQYGSISWLPVVICLSQGLSHASVSINDFIL